MGKRKAISMRRSKRNFRRTASKVNRRNLSRRVYRGGYRL